MEAVDITKIASAGKVTAMQVNVGTNDSANSGNNGGDEGAGAVETEEAKATRLQAEADAEKYKGLSPEEITAKKAEETTAAEELAKNTPPALNEEQLKAIFKQTFGEDFTGNIDDLKAKLKSPAASAAAPTPEEQAKIDAEWDKKQLDVYVAAGGKGDAYYAAKKVLEMDVNELSIADVREELKKGGIPESEIDSVIKARYFQFNIDELTQGENESDDAFKARKEGVQKQIDFGKKKLEARGTNIKANADKFFKDLRKSIEVSDKQKQDLDKEETTISSTVDEVISKIPKKVTFELGKVNDTDQAPVEYEVSEADIKEIHDLLKDKTARNNILFKEDGSLNVPKIAEILLRNKYLENAAKVTYSEGVSRTTEFFYKKFGDKSPHDIGIGTNGKQTNGVKGKIVSAASPQPSQRPVPQ